ncbi:NAD-binding protein [Methylobacterium sp. WL7]|uniref:NAD-binding protein n=1 Tax=Methylobacterium sp. WL7 TaxID=2603900 RepID=UPI0011CBAF2A|nr:NAD-binding protein [Methylobacterium sp. WL7]TXN42915.1 hypothetical protein FV233_20665 [Methylobacterium sp. WL7]
MSSVPATRGNQFKNSSWLALAPFAAVAFGLAFWGFGQHCTGTPCSFPTALEQIGQSVNLVRGRGSFTFGKDPWQLVFAQWLVPLAAILTAAKLFLQSLRRDLKVAFARRSRDHVIVCGLGDTGRAIAERLREVGERVVAVDLDATSVNALAVEDVGAPAIQGDAKSAATLRIAGVRRAKALVVTTGNDTTNLEIALAAAQRAPAVFRGTGKLVVAPEMRTDWLFERFLSQSAAGLSSESVDFQIFNRSEMAARLLYRRTFFVTQVARACQTEIAVIGFGDLGRAIVAQGLRTAFALPGHRLRVAVFDATPEPAHAKFRVLYPGADNFAVIDAIEAHLTGQEPESCALLSSAFERQIAAVFVCLPDDAEALFVATQARGMLDRQGQLSVPVFVRTRARRKLADLLAQGQDRPLVPDRLVPFSDCVDLLASGLTADREIDLLARACHETYLDTVQDQPRGGAGRLPWPMLPELFRRSNRLFADHLEIKLRAAGLRSCPAATPRLLTLTDAELETLAAAEHWRWFIERRMAGWQYGAIRDDLRLQHPALKDWVDLPHPVRVQTRAIVERIPAILARLGRDLRREHVVVYDPARPETAVSALDTFDPVGPEHLVLALDLESSGSLAIALRAASKPHVTLRLRCGAHDTRFAGLADGEIRLLRERIDVCSDAVEDSTMSSAPEPSCSQERTSSLGLT